MNTLIVVFASLMALASASVGSLGGTVVKGPSGVVTNLGAVGPNGLPNGAISSAWAARGALVAGPVLGGPIGLAAPLDVAAPATLGTTIIGPKATATISGPVATSAALVAPSASVAISSPIAAGTVWGAPIGLSAPAVVAAPALVGTGLGVVTRGGGSISLSGHGVAVRGPPTAPAVIAGPSGKVVADGLWGPTATWATDLSTNGGIIGTKVGRVW